MANNYLPVYCIDDFMYDEAIGREFYINKLSIHLQQHQFITHPHRHAFYLMVYCIQGSGTHVIDFVTYQVHPGALFLMTPGQVHQWSLSEDTDGQVLFFSKAYFENYFQGKRMADISIFKPGIQLLTIDIEDTNSINVLFNEMYSEYKTHQEGSQHILPDYLDILITRLSRIATAQYPAINEQKSSTQWLIREFETLIEDHFINQQAPSFYADKLNVSVKYLNQLCKQYLDKTTTQLIHERIILEAQRLLVHDELSINAIAEALNFDDYSYFTRFFKKMTSDTPGDFRKKHGQGLNKDLSI